MLRTANTDGAGGYCVWCSNTGTLWLLRWETHKAQGGHTYEEQVLACCGFCDLGHSKHSRWGGPWNYAMSEVDVVLNGEDELLLGPEEQRAYDRMKQLRQEIERRRDEMQIPVPRAPQLDADAYADHLDTDQDTDTLTVRAEGQAPSPDTDETRS